MKLTKKVDIVPNLKQIKSFLENKGFKPSNQYEDEYEIHNLSSIIASGYVLIPSNETIRDYSSRVLNLIQDLEWILEYPDEISVYDEIMES